MTIALSPSRPTWGTPRGGSNVAPFLAVGALIVLVLLPALAAPEAGDKTLDWHGNSAGVSSAN